MTAENSRADALTRESIEAIARKYAGAYFSGLLFQDADSFARFSDELIHAPSPVEQPAAAPTMQYHLHGIARIDLELLEREARALAPTAPAPAAEDVRAWETDDGRVISDEQKQQALRDGGASASSVRPFSIALGRISCAQAAVPVAIYQILTEEGAWLDTTREYYDRAKSDPVLARVVYIAPPPAAQASGRALYERLQALMPEWYPDAWEDMLPKYRHAYADASCDPAQAPARAGLTDDLLQRCRELLELNEKGESPQVALRALADTYHADISPHDRRSMAKSQTQIEAMRALLAAHPGQPEPRAEAISDDQRDVVRWRTLMKNGEPEVFVERTQRRAIQRTSPVAFSSPNLTGADRFDTPSEMWVKRYVMFAWWARENEHRKFIEAVDAIAAGTIQ
ncbi:hypothetical protein [Burkholderia cenocepacia]|uniref:hypothetical protein n=1 Tax=Burkholderia cenocepacia TaxID=95486 RepID=UPI0028BC5AD4|nr:hypothetical protein [Burkholderia cenocepacia]MDT6993843.1 hypothetical protein [Burkholderia cenocepacia]